MIDTPIFKKGLKGGSNELWSPSELNSSGAPYIVNRSLHSLISSVLFAPPGLKWYTQSHPLYRSTTDKYSCFSIEK